MTMGVDSRNGDVFTATSAPTFSKGIDDPLLQWLWSIEKERNSASSIESTSSSKFDKLVTDCIETFKKDPRYQNDVRFLKIWFIHMDGCADYEGVFKEMLKNKICVYNAMLYEVYALVLEKKGRLIDAFFVYHLGIARNAQPINRLKKAQVLFLERVSDRVTSGSLQKMDQVQEKGTNYINPWMVSTIKTLLQQINPHMIKYDGYHASTKPYKGKVAFSTLQKSGRNKTIEIGGSKYHIKGCAGQGGFAQVFKAFEDGNPEDVVALKIQKPAFPWEFYMYRQLDKRIPQKERMKFGFAHKMHLYSDYSILVSNFLANGTLQDAINSNVVIGGFMEEVLCIYYTIEMLYILETLYDAAIIHGDFKPDNLMIRYARDNLTEDKDDFYNHSGPWKEQGLCLVDWGRGIDMRLFPDHTQFTGDCRTSGFRCIQMQEKKPWTFQVDTYGLCVIAHMMLHNNYMELERKESVDGSYNYQPKAPFKRYWQVELWRNLFRKLLNFNSDEGEEYKSVLREIRQSFQEYMCSNPQLIKKLKQVLMKQRSSMCSS